jgi:hypothetical protein
MLFFSSVILFASVPFFINGCVAAAGTALAPVYFGGFCAATFLAITAMGGVFSVLPPYEAELYGPKYIGPIHSRFLPFSTVRGIAGPWLILGLRGREEREAAADLLARADPEAFRRIFGCDLSEAAGLLDATALPLAKLMAVSVPGTVDPSPFLYNTTMYTMAGLAALAAMSHSLIKPVHPKFHEKKSL